MKVKVVIPYTDKYDETVHLVGDEVELTKERFTELSEGGFVEAIESAKAARAKKED